jgi:micrococcal nuclease
MYNYNANLVRVIDGDSIIVDIDLGFHTWLNKISVRLSDIDTPELRTQDVFEKKAAILAKERVEELLSDGKLVITTILDTKDKFGRIFGIIHTSTGINVNDILLEEKLAIKWTGQSLDERKQLHHENLIWLKAEGKIYK